ncbi:hypothetical protein ACIQI7_31210 [Kitasatospora sp. NPDC092039]|uniref:hypothetical protein n=1 Tax=Kitasatospora sp. NPDC092039 TaxID=3364086 RepID=UPI0038024F2E
MAEYLHATLPVEGGRIAAVPEVVEAARRAETLYGINLLDDHEARAVVTKHLRLRNRVGSYAEPAWLLIIMAIVATSVTGNWAAVILGVPAGIALWAWGAHRASEKDTASVHFTAYIGLLNRARRAGMTFQLPSEWGADADRASWEEGPAADPLPQPQASPAANPSAAALPAVAAQPGSWWPAEAVIDPKFPVLPVAALAQHPALAGRAREIGAPHGLDFLDEQAVRGLLTAVKRSRRWISTWGRIFILTVVAGMIIAPLGMDPAGAEHRRQLTSLGMGLIAIGVITAVPALKELWTWRRSGLRDHSNAYLDLLVEARAYGVPVPVPPAWLDVRNRIRKPS